MYENNQMVEATLPKCMNIEIVAKPPKKKDILRHRMEVREFLYSLRQNNLH